MFLTSLCIQNVKVCLCQNCDCFLFETSSYTCPHQQCLHFAFLQLILYLPEAAGMSPITTCLSSLDRHRAQQQVCTYMTIHANLKPAVLPYLGTWLEELPPCTIVHRQHGSQTKPGHKKVAAGLPVGSQNYKIIEYPYLEGIHKDHQAQLPAPNSTTQNSNPMSESIAHTLFELRQLGAVPTSLRHCSMPPPSGTDPVPSPQLPLP